MVAYNLAYLKKKVSFLVAHQLNSNEKVIWKKYEIEISELLKYSEFLSVYKNTHKNDHTKRHKIVSYDFKQH